MSVKNIVKFIDRTAIDSATFTGAYQAINPTGLPFPCILIKIVNGSTVPIVISTDISLSAGQDVYPANSAGVYDLQTNALPVSEAACFPAGTIFYVKAAAGVGFVSLVGIYQPQGQ